MIKIRNEKKRKKKLKWRNVVLVVMADGHGFIS